MNATPKPPEPDMSAPDAFAADPGAQAAHLPSDAMIETLRSRLGAPLPEVAIVLGSGLGGLADALRDPARIPYEDIPDHPRPTVAGHRGEWIRGKLGDRDVLLQSGRFHLYEGHAPAHCILPVRLMAALGVRTLIVTNAAGCLRKSWDPPALMLVADHLNMSMRSALRGPVAADETRFPDLADPYDAELREIASAVALEEGIRLHEGVYASVLGPSYETPAEVRMLDRLGADAVGMSTVPEVIAAKALGLRVLAVSSLTNLGAGISPVPLDHGEVLEAGDQVRESLERLVRGFVARL